MSGAHNQQGEEKEGGRGGVGGVNRFWTEWAGLLFTTITVEGLPEWRVELGGVG